MKPNTLLFALIFLAPLLISVPLTKPVYLPLTYSVVLGMFVGAFSFINFLRYRVVSKKYRKRMLIPVSDRRIAAVIAVYNEDPEIVRGTAISVLSALKGRGDVFVLDDSDREDVRRGIDELEKLGIRIFRREARRGYKAGAVNDFLRVFGDDYDLIAIFDADQRPLPSFFDELLPHFDDSVAFVQAPQAYTEVYTGVGEAAFWQQQPFLRVIMRARTPFSLESGTVFRVRCLKEVGGLDEKTITEDVSTSIDLHSMGYRSVYVDRELLWFGIPPLDLKAYISQQSRWAFGSFQIIGKLLKSNLDFRTFVDYFAGWLYWLKVGPVTLAEMLAPVFFLLFSIRFMLLDPVLYLAVYIPFFASTLSVFLAGMRDAGYGLRAFLHHQSIQLLEFWAVTSAFISWILGRERPFSVTPKKAGKFPLKLLTPHLLMLGLLVASAIRGIVELSSVNTVKLKLTLLINVMWAAYYVPFLVFGMWIAKKYYGEWRLRFITPLSSERVCTRPSPSRRTRQKRASRDSSCRGILSADLHFRQSSRTP